MFHITKADALGRILDGRAVSPVRPGDAFAPANIALCKYWGKRNPELNLPVTSSLSISLGRLGTTTRIEAADRDEVVLNGTPLPPGDPFASRLIAYLDALRGENGPRFHIDTTNTVPTAAGLASSASGFAALVLALNQACEWDLDDRALSMLARMGSGSAARSITPGFVEWHAGTRDDGGDSYAAAMATAWPALRIGLVVVSSEPKRIGSREAMEHTVRSSALYDAWPGQVAADLAHLHTAIADRDLDALGATAEGNALAMHATMIAARPAILYWLPESLAAMGRVHALRAEGVPVYFTMDAGPNVKVLFEENHEATVAERLTCTHVAAPFG